MGELLLLTALHVRRTSFPNTPAVGVGWTMIWGLGRSSMGDENMHKCTCMYGNTTCCANFNDTSCICSFWPSLFMQKNKTQNTLLLNLRAYHVVVRKDLLRLHQFPKGRHGRIWLGFKTFMALNIVCLYCPQTISFVQLLFINILGLIFLGASYSFSFCMNKWHATGMFRKIPMFPKDLWMLKNVHLKQGHILKLQPLTKVLCYLV